MPLKFGTSGVRGLNSEFTLKAVDAYINGFLELAQTKMSLKAVAIGGDLRESTPGILMMIQEILKKKNLLIHDCGTLPTPALALFCSEKGVPGIMVTGSHIPSDRNGIKFYWPWGEILKDDEASITNYYRTVSERFQSETGYCLDENTESLDAVGARQSYINRYVQFFEPYKAAFKDKKIFVYQHSTVSRDWWKPILTGLGFQVIEGGRSSVFTPVDTETDEATERLKTLFEGSAPKDLFAVVSSDGDADRPFLCDENLKMIRGDTIGILSALFLEADLVVTPVSSNTALEKTKSFSDIRRTQIGSPYVIESMMGENKEAVVGFEANGGLLLGSRLERNGKTLSALPTRDSVLPILCCLALAAHRGLTLSELVNSLPGRVCFTETQERRSKLHYLPR